MMNKPTHTQRNINEIARIEGRVPPSSIRAEKCVLGAMLIDYHNSGNVMNMLQPGMFYNQAHETIFRAIVELYRKRKPIDILSVSEELKKKSELDEVGGYYYLSQLTLEVGSAAHIEHHALIILEAYIRRMFISISTQSINDGFDTSVPTDDALATLEKKLGELTQLMNVKQDIYHISTVANDAIDEVYNRIQKAENGIPAGMPTGFRGLDALTFGWKPAELIVLAARPSMGKTAVMLHFAKAAANAGSTALIFSLEMSRISLADRLLLSESNEGEININHYKGGHMSQQERSMLEVLLTRIHEKPIYINDTPGLTIGQIRASAKEMRKQGKCDVVFIDYLQLCKGKGVSNNRTRDIEVSEISREAKEMAKELNVPVIFLSQLSREVEKRTKKQPILSDLRDSGSIEQDADMVIFVYRPEYYKQSTTDKYGNPIENYGELIVSKNRNGRCGEVAYTHSFGMTKFFDYQE
jgi:replicative DNA helicase